MPRPSLPTEPQTTAYETFDDRVHAGRRLGLALQKYRDRAGLLVLGLPRGGIPVAYEVAKSLEAPLDLLVVRKLGVPGHQELAFGAITSGDICVLNPDVFEHLPLPQTTLAQVRAVEKQELERRIRIYCGSHQAPQLSGRCVIVVDDGIATGATIRAALQAVRQAGASTVVAAAPTAPASIYRELQSLADEIVILTTPTPFYAVSQVYRDFSQTSDEQVRQILIRAWQPQN